MFKHIYCFLFLGTTSVFASNINYLKPVADFQDDEWSCGVHSAYRSLHHFDLADSYYNLKKFIGQQEYKYNLSKEITEKVDEKVCKWLGPFEHVCSEVTKVVSRVTTVKIPLKLGIGRGPHQLAAKISEYGVNSKPTERASFQDIERLVDQKIPVLTLIQIGVKGWELISYPELHWIVVTGYDQQNIYYYDTEANNLEIKDRAEFYNQWDWNDGWNKRNSPVHLHLTRNEGLEVRSIVNFQDEKIDRIILLEGIEKKASTNIASATIRVERTLDSSKVKGVKSETAKLRQSSNALEEKANDVLDTIGLIIKEH